MLTPKPPTTPISAENLLTWTPLPTMPSAEAAKLVLDFMKNNAGCQFPCWWGITPGDTTWENARRRLIPLSYNNDLSKENVYIYNKKSDDSFSAGFSFMLGETVIDQGYVIKNNIVEYIEIRSDVGTYTLLSLVLAYGKPEEVWVGTYNYAIQGQLPFDLLLEYPTKGFLAYFAGSTGQINQDIVNMCYKDPKVYALDLWNPDSKYSLEQIAKVGGLFNLRLGFDTFKRLQDTTSLSIDAFVEKVNNDKVICISTPAKYWKSPFD